MYKASWEEETVIFAPFGTLLATLGQAKERPVGKGAPDSVAGPSIFPEVFNRLIVSRIHFVTILAGSEKAQCESYRNTSFKKNNKNKT